MRKIGDFAAAFVITAGLLMCIALVSQADFFEQAVKWNREEYSLRVFDSVFVFDKDVPEKMEALLSVNDIFTFKGFAALIERTALWLLDYVNDILSIVFTAAKEVTGSR